MSPIPGGRVYRYHLFPTDSFFLTAMFVNRSVQIYRSRASLLLMQKPAATTSFSFVNSRRGSFCQSSDDSTHQRHFSTLELSNKPEPGVTRSKIAAEIARNHDLSLLKSQRILNTVLDIIVEAVGDDRRVTLKNFGSFDSYFSKERMGVNPLTREKISIPSKRRIRFKASRTFGKSSDERN
jgi:nucleoid DNA-binding protein